MLKITDAEKLLKNIPEQNNLPRRRSELYRLYKRLVNRLHLLGLDVKMTTHIVKDPDQEKMKELERAFLTNECLCLIRTLKERTADRN